MTRYYCNKPLLDGSGAYIRVGLGQHAHQKCFDEDRREQLKAEGVEDPPCQQCHEYLDRCLCCPECRGREHSNFSDCETCAYYQQRRPSEEYAKRHPDEVREIAAEREVEAWRERRHEEAAALN